ncbi:MAG: hypothetical protein HQM09_23855 [Candidatus Riflebacteria bacterium]|nr:hypothetical protein [Candidatus Riflebacteria bacterium]
MLVIHWAKYNLTAEILANGIHPSRSRKGAEHGVFCYPFFGPRVMWGNWRRILKRTDGRGGNYNGFVFRLSPGDFPLQCGHWLVSRYSPKYNHIKTMAEMVPLFREIIDPNIYENWTKERSPIDWDDFQIIIPRLINPKRIIRVIRDRAPASIKTVQQQRRSQTKRFCPEE